MMMLKNLKKSLNSIDHSDELFDIVVFGSILKGKKNPGDVDIIFIFKSGTLKERLDKIQSIKMDLLSNFPNVIFDIKQILLVNLFSDSFFAKTGLLLEGFSIFSNSSFSNRLGFNSFVEFNYDLTSLTHTQKVKFNYILSGRNSQGVLSEFSAIRLAPGLVRVPLASSIFFERILNNNNITFTKKNILESF